jgi:copper oxidase (laccase) domain-containing protein
LHSGWRGTVAGIVEHGIDALARRGFPASELRVHLGPAICGRCYEVSADVATKLTGRRADGAECVDLRAIIADQAQRAGIKLISVSDLCTRCDNARLYSHRAGDTGRQVAAMVAQL